MILCMCLCAWRETHPSNSYQSTYADLLRQSCLNGTGLKVYPSHFAQESKSSVLVEPLSVEKDSSCVHMKYVPAQSKKAGVVETNKATCMVPVPRKVSFLTQCRVCAAKTWADFGWTSKVIPEPARHFWQVFPFNTISLLKCIWNNKCWFLSKISFSWWSQRWKLNYRII